MDDIGKTENNVKNGNSSVPSSPDSVDRIPSDSNATSASDLPSSASGYHPIDSSATTPTKSKAVSSFTSNSEGTISDLTFETLITPVKSLGSPSTESDYKGTRFVVKRMESSELQKLPSANNSPRSTEKSPDVSPKSVNFFFDGRPSPSEPKLNSPKKSSTGLPKVPKSFTINTMDTTDAIEELQPNKLFAPLSQDSFPVKEEIELPSISHRVNSSPRGESSDEDSFTVAGDRSKVPLLSDSETELINRAQSAKPINARDPTALSSTMSVQEIPNTPGATSEGTTTINRDIACEKCIVKSTYIYIAAIVGIIIGAIIFWTCLFTFGIVGPHDLYKPGRNNLGHVNVTIGTTTPASIKLANETTTIFESPTNASPTTADTNMYVLKSHAPIIEKPTITAVTDAPIINPTTEEFDPTTETSSLPSEEETTDGGN